ncbi:MAG TPA: carbamoyltransferase HypF [Kofleriaceae bacterium]|nr:carbamoyltransferase HypF [Kofleriaceae bacterium]
MPGLRIEIRGIVQGVGFRPWVFRIARELGVAGRVHNHARGVTVEAFAGDAVLDRLVARLREPPPPARVRDLSAAAIPAETCEDFVIVHSAGDGPRALSIPPDLATCPDCEREIRDPADRRAGYAFTNCTACGPRFTIATGVPYDRPATTMSPFVMCPACQHEYEDPRDRRFHAQPNACPVCGPRLALWSPSGEPIAGDPIEGAAARLVRGEIVAVKGLGGFHLACDATSDAALATLRTRKHRDEKPFAVMVADVDVAHALAVLSHEEAALLASPERPIVLVARRPMADVAPGSAGPRGIGDAPLAALVAPDTDLVGLMLPYTPLHHLLLARVARPLVMTSANRSDEPICTDNDEAIARLGSIADALVVHDRAIATRCDDSVARVIAGSPTLLRRSRGYVPRAIALARPVAHTVLGVGAQLKNTFCLADGDNAYLGPHIGDLENVATLEAFEAAVARMEEILRVRPEVIAHDLHPGYTSTQYARARSAARHVAVQHHHAHVASAMAEHGLAGPVVGVAYDGTGWGTDGTAWGGEILLARYEGFERLATFRPIALAGGDLAIREPWRIALALIDDAFGDAAPIDHLAVFAGVPERAIATVRGMIRGKINAPQARGIGRMFDAVGALALARRAQTYEGQLAVAWNLAAAPGDHGVFPFAVDHAHGQGSHGEIDLRPLVRAAVGELFAGTAPGVISARFHDTLVAATVDRVRAAIAAHGRLPVVFTGGAFHNPRLAEGVRRGLSDLEVYSHGEVPPGDGGIALGQALVADAVARHA